MYNISQFNNEPYKYSPIHYRGKDTGMLLFNFCGGTDISVIVSITACGRSTSTAIEGIREDLGRKFYKPESIDTRTEVKIQGIWWGNQKEKDH